MQNVIPYLDQLLDEEEAWQLKLDPQLKRSVEAFQKKGEGVVSCATCTNPNPGCCHQKILVPFLEALPIARHLRRTGQDSPALRAALRAEGEQMEGATRDDWFYTQPYRPCVFLKEGRCSIYRRRPTPCRTYLVVTPPALCQQENRHATIGSLDTRNGIHQILERARVLHVEAFGLRENNMRLLLGCLPRMVALALEVWEDDNYADVIRREIWPTADELPQWAEGHVFHDKHQALVQIRKTRAG